MAIAAQSKADRATKPAERGSRTERGSKTERSSKTERGGVKAERSSKGERGKKSDLLLGQLVGHLVGQLRDLQGVVKAERVAGLLASGRRAIPLIVIGALSLVLLLLYFFRISPLHSSTTKEEQQQMRTAAELDEYSEPSFDSQTPLRGDFRAETAAAGAGGGNFRVESGSRAAGKSFAEEGNGIQSSSRHGLVSSADVLKNPSAFRELLAGKRGWWGEEGEGEDGGGVTDGGLGLGAGGGAERGSKEWGGGGAGRQGERQERGNAVERQASKDSREKNDNGSGDSSGSRSGSRLGGNPGAAAMGSPGDIPVVQFLRARTGCGRGRYAFETLKQARRLNSRVILIGPRVCKRVMEAEGVQVEDYEEYKGVEEAFEKNVGEVVSYQVRWFILHEFMRRWSLPRIFYMDCDVLLFANVTHFVHTHLPKADLALAGRTPTIHVRAVSAHVSLWSLAALADFLSFFRLFFQLGVVGGTPGDRSLPAQRTYNDMVVLGWYAAPVCWTNTAKDRIPKDCLAPSMRVMSARIRGRFTPAFKAESLCAPRQCEASAWSDAGWCAFDNNFSLTINHTTFHYDPLKMKTPTSMHYDHFTDWMAARSGPASVLLVLTALAVVLGIVFLLFADVILIGIFKRFPGHSADEGLSALHSTSAAATSAANLSVISDLLQQEEMRQQQLRQQQLRQQQERSEKLPMLTLLLLKTSDPAMKAPGMAAAANPAAATANPAAAAAANPAADTNPDASAPPDNPVAAATAAAVDANADSVSSEATQAAAQGAAAYNAANAAGSSIGATYLTKPTSTTSDSSTSSFTVHPTTQSGNTHPGMIPVVQFLRGEAGCNRGRYMQASLRQALLHNTWLILIGPRACRDEMTELGIELEAYEDYEESARIEEQYIKGIGKVMAFHIRWFFLHEMMVRRNISRVFYTDCDVLLFVNVTEYVQSHLPEAKLALGMRSNSVRIRAVSGHVSLWSVDALADFLAFFVIFFQEAVAGGTPGDPSLPAQQRTYNDMVQLGWYASPTCWTSSPDQAPKTCKDKEKSAQYPRIHGKFQPAFKAESLCAPRQCEASAWSDAGWCAFDNNFSVGKKRKFHYCPREGMKTPTSVRYDFELELLLQNAQIFHYFDGSYSGPAEDTADARAQYYNESLMAYGVLLRNMSPAKQLSIRSYKTTSAPALDAWRHLNGMYQPKDSIGRAHSENGVYILDFDIPDCSGDSQELIDLVPLRFEHIHHCDWKHPDGRPWVPHHPHPRELALHDPDPDGICRDCHTPTASTSAIAGRGLAAIAEAEREAPSEEGLSNMELETATRVVFRTREHPLPGPASQHLRGMLRGTGVGTLDANGVP
ncbi:unnamed protein product [Closterium sp. NIES-53]